MANAVRKMNKAIYLILEKYHRLYGLKLMSFAGGHGYGYGMFYLDSVPPGTGGMIQTDYKDRLEEKRSNGKRVSLVFYLGEAGLPAWSNGCQAQLEDWQRCRTSTIIEWLEANLSLKDLFCVFREEVARWRTRYTVEQSEKYLLAMNLAGLHCADSDSILYNHYALFSEYDPDGQEKTSDIENRLNISNCFGDIWGSKDILFSTNGFALISFKDVIDTWEMYQVGMSSHAILEELNTLARA